MSKITLLLAVGAVAASFVGAAQANPYPRVSWESTGAPFERCWWESGPSRPYRMCMQVPPAESSRYRLYNPDISPFGDD